MKNRGLRILSKLGTAFSIMRKRMIMALFLFLSGGATGGVYKWVDDSGVVHYGDSPPKDRETQTIVLPKGPSQDQVEHARQEMQLKLEKQRASSKKEISPLPQEETSPAENSDNAASPGNVSCFDPLSEQVSRASAELHREITPTELSEAQKKQVTRLFRRMEGRWRGTSERLSCISNTSDPKTQITTGEARTSVDWIGRENQLVIETNTASVSGSTQEILRRIEVGSVLYFTNSDTTTFPQKIDETELVELGTNAVSFLTKRRIGSRKGAERALVRRFEIDDKAFVLTEYAYTQGHLSDVLTLKLKK